MDLKASYFVHVIKFAVLRMSDKMNDLYDSMNEPRYCGIPTFMRAPYITDFNDIDIALLGIPYDGAVEARSGARQGPRQIRDYSSMMRKIHHVTRINPYALCRVGDVGDVSFKQIFDVESSHRDIEGFIEKLHRFSVIPISAGGDHSITLPIMRALGKDKPVGMIHIDAHTDCCDEEMNSKYSHCTPFRRAVEEGVLDPKRTVQIGIRGAANSKSAGNSDQNTGFGLFILKNFQAWVLKR